MQVKKFRNLVETNYEELFDDEKVFEYLSSRIELAELNNFYKFIIKYGTWFFITFIILGIGFIVLAFIIPILFIIFIILGLITFGLSALIPFLKSRIKNKIETQIRSSINILQVYKIILNKIENLDIHEINAPHTLESYLWNYSNVVSRTTMNFSTKTTYYSTSRNEKLKTLSPILKGFFNGKEFNVGVATWQYETRNSKNNKIITYKDSCILKVEGHAAKIDNPVFVNDKNSSIGQIDKLENREFNKYYQINTPEALFSRKIFTLYTQELWLKLLSMGINSFKAGIYQDKYVQVVTGKNFNQKAFILDIKRLKDVNKQTIINQILFDVKEDLKTLMLLLSYFGTSEVMNK